MQISQRSLYFGQLKNKKNVDIFETLERINNIHGQIIQFSNSQGLYLFLGKPLLRFAQHPFES